MSDIYRDVIGVVQFDPRDAEAAGKKIRNVTIRCFGVKDQAIKVGLTVWPSHAGVEIAKGDLLAAEGKFSQNVVTKDDGEKVTYNNLSVAGLKNLGSLDFGKKTDVVNEVADDEDIPF